MTTRMIKENNSTTAIVISAGGSPVAFDIVRALGAAGIRSAVASSDRRDIAFYSRYCTHRIALPHFDRNHHKEIFDRIKSFSMKQAEMPVLYYSSDPELMFVARFRDELSPYCRFLLPSENVLQSTFNKTLFGPFAVSKKLPVPQTTVVRDRAELESVIDSIQFPCIVKPAFSQDWEWESNDVAKILGPYKHALRRILSKDELLHFCSLLPESSSGFLIQSYIEGLDKTIVSFHGYFDEDSQCQGFFLGQKIRTYPPRTGGSTYIKTICHHELAIASIEYLQKIQFKGVVKIDYKWDARSYEYKILEINPRYTLWEVVGALSGMNLAYRAYCHQRGESFDKRQQYRSHLHFIYFKQDFRSFLFGYTRLGEWTFWGYVRSLWTKKYYRILDIHDLRPFIVSVCNFIVRTFARLFSLGGRVIQRNPGKRNIAASSSMEAN